MNIIKYEVGLEMMRCVYLLYNKGNIVYVGKTNNLDRRIYQHNIGDWCELPKDFDMVLGYIIQDKKQRTEVEKELIKRFKPKYNGMSAEHILPSDEEVRIDFGKVEW